MKIKGMEVQGIIKVDNAEVYGLKESILASAYPMMVSTLDMDDYKLVDTNSEMQIVKNVIEDLGVFVDIEEKHMKRAKHLGRAIPGSGHDCYLKGITLQFDLQLPEYIWRQLDRYHHIDYISSQSKMHRIVKLDTNEVCNKYVSGESLRELNYWINLYNNFDNTSLKHDIILRNGDRIEFTKDNIFRMIIANTPSGIMLTARMTTNYLQLKSIINQRENHKMQEWLYLTDWFKSLPLVDDIVLRTKVQPK